MGCWSFGILLKSVNKVFSKLAFLLWDGKITDWETIPI